MKDCCQAAGTQTATGSRPGARAYDLAVLGAGSAGFSAAITAARAGKRVALIGHGTMGGTCVNVGCVPSKALIRAAEAVHAGPSAARFPGVGPCTHAVDWPALIAGKEALVSTLRQKKYADLLSAYEGLDYIDEGPGRLAEGGVAVNGRLIRAERVILATGSRPVLPDIPGIDDVGALDSTALMDLPARPESLIFIGGGYVGAELAQMTARLGASVTLVCRSRLLPQAEPEVSEALTAAFESEGIAVIAGARYLECRREGGRTVLEIEHEGRRRTLAARHIVATAGRRANTEGLGLDEAGVERDERGDIIVDRYMHTTAPHVWAAGDVTNRDKFVYMAAHGGKVAAMNAVLGAALVYDNATMPWVVFTDPQVAGVGLTEAQARAQGLEAATSTLPLDQVPRALAARDTRGLVKLVADGTDNRLLGGQIIAPEGADSIQTLAMALKAGMTARALGETIFPYLTTVEALKLAAQTFELDVSQLSCCAG